MTRLRDCPWWPIAWISGNGGSYGPIEIRKKGVLKNVRRMGKELTLVLKCDGAIFTASIGPNLSVDFSVLLRHVLLQHCGEPISVVEHIEIDLAALENSANSA
jgi:hypothetical protein